MSRPHLKAPSKTTKGPVTRPSQSIQSFLDGLHCSTLLLHYEASVLSIRLNLPEKRNALNLSMVEELMAVFTAIAEEPAIRAVILQGNGKHFCAGGDISGMQDNKEGSNQNSQTQQQHIRQVNRRFGELSALVNAAPQVVVALLHGAVMGGGLGLACAADIAIADQQTLFVMPETSLGLVPAQIAPFMMQRIGQSQARRMALLGEHIKGEEARRVGLVHFVTQSEEQMETQLRRVLSHIQRCAPQANAITKKLLQDSGAIIDTTKINSVLDHGAEIFAEALVSDEGKEGTAAFLEQRKPFWAQQ